MKVAMIGHKVVPSRRGGIETVLTTLCPMLVEQGIDVTCYNRSSDKVENEYVGTVENRMYKGVKLKCAWTVNLRGFAAMIASFTAAISAAFGKYDVVHFHAEGPCAALWISKLFGKKCVATVHGLDWQREKWGKGFASKYIKFGEKVLVKYADEVIVLSRAAHDYFKETYNRETTIIHNGISRPERKEANLICEQFGLRKDEYLLLVSRLTAEKGIHYLIDAYNRIETNQKLVIAGDTSDTDEYVAELKAKAAGNPNILFTGFVSGDLLQELYSNAYLFVLPSDLEGMSLCLLESLSFGNALLCSDIPENTAVAEDHAMYFRKGNVADLAEKLGALCADSSLVEKLRDGADEFIVNKYSWQDVAEATCRLYQR
ncbi:MAG: glycosyltransferase family 4 protein [Oscillospiraceae bacterium]|nr:glycosyltransferase family 4 protein [Oscillospiraceae bacterium]